MKILNFVIKIEKNKFSINSNIKDEHNLDNDLFLIHFIQIYLYLLQLTSITLTYDVYYLIDKNLVF